jgi:hypothetical protein
MRRAFVLVASIVSVLAVLLFIASRPCVAMMSIEHVSRERARELGLEIRSNAAGPGAARVELEFGAKGELKKYLRVDLLITEGEKSLLFATLREDPSRPGRAAVSCAADRGLLDKATLRVVVGVPMDLAGYDIRVKDFVEPEKAP